MFPNSDIVNLTDNFVSKLTWFFSLLLKAYAVTALMKVYSFEIAAGRKVDMLPEVGKLWSSFFLFSKFGFSII